ncbi:MAG: hypothetical protein GX605_12800 [Chloroflexi bacterium]|nr:hypothetical protein [Chloroflexota bacterium]
MQARAVQRLQDYLADTSPQQKQALLLGAILLVALAVGLYVAALTPLYALAATVVLVGGLLILRSTQWGFFAIIAVTTLLPFGALPFRIGFRPTFLDVALLAVAFVWVVRLATRRHGPLWITPVGWPLLLFMLLALASFVAGLAHANLTANLLRHFAEVQLALGLFFVVVNSIRNRKQLEEVGLVLILCGGLQALVAVVLYFLPQDLTVRLLSTLGRFEYPTGTAVLRWIEDNPDMPLRATGTAIGPNTLGGLLILVLGFTIPQIMARKPLLPRWLSAPIVAVMGLALYLTYSRTALVGLAVALGVLGVLRYRRLLLILLLVAVVFLALPQTQYYVERFLEGVRFEDRANQMRLGEYKDAFTLISRHPWLGVGFGGTPEIDTYLSVASIYLLIAGQMGVVGLGAFLLTVGTLLLFLWGRRRAIADDPKFESVVMGALMGLVGALAGGMFDHYYFNLEFPSTVTLFWLFAALAVAGANIAGQRSEAAS